MNKFENWRDRVERWLDHRTYWSPIMCAVWPWAVKMDLIGLDNGSAIAKVIMNGVGEASHPAVVSRSLRGLRLEVSADVAGQGLLRCVIDLRTPGRKMVIVLFEAPLIAETETAARRLVQNLLRVGGQRQYEIISVRSRGSFAYLWALLGFRPTRKWLVTHDVDLRQKLSTLGVSGVQGVPFDVLNDNRLRFDIFNLIADTNKARSTDLSLSSPGPKLFSMLPAWDGELKIGDLESVERLFEVDLKAVGKEAL